MVLEVCQISGMGPLVRKEADLVIDVGCKFAGSAVGTEQTAAGAFGAVPVGACEAAVNGKLNGFFSEILFQPGADGIKTLVSELWRAGFFFCVHRVVIS